MFYVHRFLILKRSVAAWKLALERLRRIDAQKWDLAERRGVKAIKRFYWSTWVEWTEENKIQREIDQRSELAWNKVQAWLK